jgi:hypothetical protein
MIAIDLGTKSLLFKNIVLRESQNKFNGEFKVQNKKDKRTKADAKKATADVGKTAASGNADAKKGVANAGGKEAHGKTDGKKGWKK